MFFLVCAQLLLTICLSVNNLVLPLSLAVQLPRSSLQPSKVEQEVGDEVVVVDNDDNSGIIPIATSPSIHLHSRSLPVVRPLINIAVHSYINCISE